MGLKTKKEASPMENAGLEQKKRILRRAYAEKAALQTEAELSAASRQIAARVLRLPVWQRASSVFVYVSMPGEPATSALIDAALHVGKRVFAPRCRGRGQMDAVEIFSRADLLPGAFGIPEPVKALPAADPAVLDLAIVPCVCAGRDGRRLGHGAGYYDRFLCAHPICAVCLCFESLLTDGLPAGPLDVIMDAVITEKGVYAAGGSGALR